MANKEHLTILKQGADAWNQWRDENPEIRPALDQVDLSGKSFKESDFPAWSCF